MRWLPLALILVAGSAPAAKFLEVPDDVKRLEVFYGTWKGEGSLMVNGRAVSFKAKWSCGMATGGWAVTCKLSGRIPGLGQYDEHDVFGFDEGARAIHWFSTTSRGEVHDHVGRWIDGQTLVLEYRPVGREFVERVTITFTAGGELLLNTQIAQAGKPATAMTLRLKK